VTAVVRIDVSRVPDDGTLVHLFGWVAASGGFSASASRTMVVDSTPKVQVVIEEDQDPVAPGGTLTYTVSYGNRTTSDATGVVLRVPVPAETSFVSATEGGVNRNGMVEWALDRLSAGESGSVQLKVGVDGALAEGSRLVAEAELRDGAQPQSSGFSQTATTVKSASVLTLDITANPSPARSGEHVTFAFTVANGGLASLDNVLLQAILPDFSDSFSRPDLSDGGTCSGGCVSGARTS
jgi:uncharacterized repeat protein (TIGR01451 family)